jgi:hypothetical protein
MSVSYPTPDHLRATTDEARDTCCASCVPVEGPTSELGSVPRTGAEYAVYWDTTGASECSYCFERTSRPLDPFVRCCACKDRPTHASCLLRWLKTRPCHEAPHQRYRCEVCDEAYLGGARSFAGWVFGLGLVGVVDRALREVTGRDECVNREGRVCEPGGTSRRG